jgi:hypothetical protein
MGGSGSWECSFPEYPECLDAQPYCPAANDIQPGGTCDIDPSLSCGSDIPIYDCDGQVTGYVSCFCYAGGWSCPMPPLPECPDASGTCPAPKSIAQGVPCSAEGEQCPGNPQECGGQMLYDAFQCTAGQWDDVATTFCDLDAGGPD